MERDSDLLWKLADFLRSHGYPAEAFATEWKVGKRHRADLAIVDPATAEPVAIFELKRDSSAKSLRMAEAQLRAMWQDLDEKDVPLYAVAPDPAQGLVLHRFDPNVEQREKGALTPLPDFRLLLTTRRAKAASEVVTSRKRSFDQLRIAAWVVAAVVAALGAADFSGWIEVTPERLGLVALFAGLVILPFAGKLKLLGLEFERVRDSKQDSSG